MFDFARKTQGPVSIAGRELPAGAVIGPASPLVNRNADVYDDRLAFRPERWLDGARPSQSTFITFGGGVRRCLGAAFAQYRDAGRAGGDPHQHDAAPGVEAARARGGPQRDDGARARRRANPDA